MQFILPTHIPAIDMKTLVKLLGKAKELYLEIVVIRTITIVSHVQEIILSRGSFTCRGFQTK